MKPKLKVTKAAEPSAKKVLGRPFKSGDEWNGNAAGRPKGSRSKLNEDFIRAMSEDFMAHGKDVIEKVRVDQPGVYLKVVASLQPKEIDIRDKTLSDMTDQEVFDALAEIRSLKASIASKSKAPKFPMPKVAN